VQKLPELNPFSLKTMPINIERGVIRKVYRVNCKKVGWCAIPFIALDKGGLVTPVASFEHWPIPWIASFVGHRVEVLIDSNEKCILLPFHNQHQQLLPPLIEHLTDKDPGTFQALPLLEQAEGGSSQIVDAVNPIAAAMRALDEVFKEHVTFPERKGKQKAGFLDSEGRKHHELDESGAKERYRKAVLAHREALKRKRNQEKAQTALLRDALLKSILKGKFLSRTGAKVRMDLVLYLEENRDKPMSAGELIGLIRKLTKKYSQEDHAQTE